MKCKECEFASYDACVCYHPSIGRKGTYLESTTSPIWCPLNNGENDSSSGAERRLSPKPR